MTPDHTSNAPAGATHQPTPFTPTATAPTGGDAPFTSAAADPAEGGVPLTSAAAASPPHGAGRRSERDLTGEGAAPLTAAAAPSAPHGAARRSGRDRTGGRPPARRGLAWAVALLVGALLAAGAGTALAAQPAAQAAPRVSLSSQEAGTGGSVTVTGKGWRPNALLTLLICGQNAIGGTNACANPQGRAVTTGSDGGFRKKLPVAEPPAACPCVVRAATVTGAYAAADAKFTVAGHPVKPLPRNAGGGRLTVLAARLEGDSGILTWFGAAPQRQLVLTVGNVGSTPAKNPVFDVGTSHGVYAPKWEQQQWRGTVAPGRKAKVTLPAELSAGAHGDYTVAAKYGGKVLTEQPWEVGRPWGVTLFWVLLCLVVPAAVFRAGMAVVDRLRPRRPGQVVSGREPGPRTARTRIPVRLPKPKAAQPKAPKPPKPRTGAGPEEPGGGGALPWFTPDTLTAAPRADDRTDSRTGSGPARTDGGAGTTHPPHRTTLSAPPDERPPSKGNR